MNRGWEAAGTRSGVGAPEHRYLIRDGESKDDGPVAQKGLWLSGMRQPQRQGPSLDRKSRRKRVLVCTNGIPYCAAQNSKPACQWRPKKERERVFLSDGCVHGGLVCVEGM